jgi:phosphatidylserine/phosphatidylglycerophosphate/cardiolipin synthase-like enzyme
MTTARLIVGATLAIWLAQVCVAAEPARPQRFSAVGSIETAFTPGDAIDSLIVNAIDGARDEVLVQAYSFTHRRIARALVRARERGVAVSVLADREQAREFPGRAQQGRRHRRRHAAGNHDHRQLQLHVCRATQQRRKRRRPSGQSAGGARLSQQLDAPEGRMCSVHEGCAVASN